jgi:hypothetical protein
MLLPRFKSILMCIADGFQVLHGLLEHVASAFQSLDLIFEAFDKGCIVVCTLSERHMSHQ